MKGEHYNLVHRERLGGHTDVDCKHYSKFTLVQPSHSITTCFSMTGGLSPEVKLEQEVWYSTSANWMSASKKI
jgi:hypothetical protein